ncbi:hypothetical protein ACWD3J_47830 [Streptomyces sp. NPDC002755]
MRRLLVGATILDRPALRAIVNELTERHPHTTGVRELHTAVAMTG